MGEVKPSVLVLGLHLGRAQGSFLIQVTLGRAVMEHGMAV